MLALQYLLKAPVHRRVDPGLVDLACLHIQADFQVTLHTVKGAND
jgi:hypothetical protein